jgi:hypothetical protein
MMTKRRQRGVSLPLMAFALAVTALVFSAIGAQRVREANELVGKTRGATLEEIARAVELYRQTNVQDLTKPLPITVPGVADPYAPTVTELRAGGFITTPMVLSDADYSIFLARSPVGCTAPAPCAIWARTALTEPILDVGGQLNADRLNALAGRVTSASVSFSGPPNPAVIVGGGGTWTVANPDPAGRAGIVVMVSGLGGSSEPWLRVGDTRNPGFAGPSVTGTQFDTPIKVVGDACTPQGAFASAANGLVYCNAGFWTIYTGPIETGATACTSEGAMGVTAGGASLICVASLWRDHLTYAFRGVGEYGHGQTVPKPSCGVGLAPFAVVSTQSASVIIGANNAGNNSGSFQSRIDPTTWLVEIVGATNVQAGLNARATVTTSCAPV